MEHIVDMYNIWWNLMNRFQLHGSSFMIQPSSPRWMAIDGMIWIKPRQGHSFVALAKFREGPAIWHLGMEHMNVRKTMKPSVVDGITGTTQVVLLYFFLLLHAVAALGALRVQAWPGHPVQAGTGGMGEDGFMSWSRCFFFKEWKGQGFGSTGTFLYLRFPLP